MPRRALLLLASLAAALLLAPVAPAHAAPTRAAPGTVGFLGDPAGLHVIDSTASAALYAPGSYWYAGGQLRVDSNADYVLDGVWVKGTIDYYGSGSLTIRNSIVESAGMGWAVVLLRSTQARFDLRDSDIVWPSDVPAPGPTWSNGCIHGDASSTMLRNDISGCPDGVQQAGGNSTYRRNWIHDLARLGVYPNNTHNDGLQLYGGPNYVVAGNYIELDGYDGTHQNAAVFFSDDGAATLSPVVQNNYLSGGGIQLRFEATTRDARVTGNTFGCICGGFAHASATGGATIATWSRNVDVDGQPVPRP